MSIAKGVEVWYNISAERKVHSNEKVTFKSCTKKLRKVRTNDKLDFLFIPRPILRKV